MSNLSEDVTTRRTEELEALQAYYGNDIRSSLVSSSSNTNIVPIEGPWFLLLTDTNKNSYLGIPTLEIRMPPSYPLGNDCPQPIIHNVMMNTEIKKELIQELKDMYELEIDVGILWGERCREELLSGEMQSPAADDHIINENSIEVDCNVDQSNDNKVRTFIPSSTRYHQPIRHFPLNVIIDSNYQRQITHTPPFRPPKSGPSEIMIAHIAKVTCMEHVHWVLAELLFNDKKVAKASHNMFAFRFFAEDSNSSTNTLVSDNDDDGEKGSGSKIASLLELSNVENVIVIVSRWFGGVHLGSARFKWIARVAKDGLNQAGFIENSR